MNRFSRHAILNLSPDMHLEKKAAVFWTISSLKTNLNLLLIYLDSNNWHSEISLLFWTLKKTNTKLNCVSAYYHSCKTCKPLPLPWLSAFWVTETQSTVETYFEGLSLFFFQIRISTNIKKAYCGLYVPDSTGFSFYVHERKLNTSGWNDYKRFHRYSKEL